MDWVVFWTVQKTVDEFDCRSWICWKIASFRVLISPAERMLFHKVSGGGIQFHCPFAACQTPFANRFWAATAGEHDSKQWLRGSQLTHMVVQLCMGVVGAWTLQYAHASSKRVAHSIVVDFDGSSACLFHFLKQQISAPIMMFHALHGSLFRPGRVCCAFAPVSRRFQTKPWTCPWTFQAS